MDNIAEIKQIINDYLADDNTDYSIMITGQWGTGKTHFLRNTLEPELDKELLYITLNGVSELQEIDKLIVLGVYPILKSKGAKVAGGLASTALKFFKLDGLKEIVELEDLPKKLNDKILCFDDLERSKIEIEQLLGYLNKYVEHLSLKTLLICNERKINDKETYKDIKEKLVGITIEYMPNYESVIKDIVKLYNVDKTIEYYKFLSNNNEVILDIFSKSKTDNIRILKQSIIYFKKVHDSIRESKNENIDITTILRFFLTVFFESRSNQLEENDFLKYLNNPYSYWMSKAFKNDGKNEATYIDNFLRKYYDGKESDVCKVRTVFNFIKTGYLDVESFINELDNIFTKKEEVVEKKSLLTENYWVLSDQEFEESCSELLDEVKNGKAFTQGYYLKLFYYFLYFSRKGAVELSAKEILDVFNQGLEIASTQWTYKNIDMKMLIAEEPKDKEYFIFKDSVFKANENLKNLEKKEKSQNLLKMAKEDFNQFIDSFGIMQVHDYLGIPVFFYWDTDNIFETLLSFSNDQLVEFHRAFQQRYSIGNTLQNYITEIENLRKLVVKIEDKVAKDPRKLSNILLSDLTLKINNTIDDLVIIKDQDKNKNTQQEV